MLDKRPRTSENCPYLNPAGEWFVNESADDLIYSKGLPMTQLVESSLKRERRKMESSCDGLLVAIRELEKEDAVLTADCVKRLRILRSLNAYVGDCFLQTSGNADMDWDADAEDDLFHRLTDELNQRLDELTGIRERIRELERRRERYVYELTLCTVAATTLLMPPTNGKA